MEHSKPVYYPLKRKNVEQSAYEYLMELRKNDPLRLALARISVKWDELNNQYEREGISAEFIAKRKDLKEFIRRSALTAEQLQEFMDKHLDHYNGNKFVHGYNWNYKTKQQ